MVNELLKLSIFYLCHATNRYHYVDNDKYRFLLQLIAFQVNRDCEINIRRIKNPIAGRGKLDLKQTLTGIQQVKFNTAIMVNLSFHFCT